MSMKKARAMNAFVTGASRGIGRTIVLKYVKEGWGVAFTYASKPEGAEETIRLAKEINPDVKIKAYQLDLADRKAIETVCEQVLMDFDDIEAVVNNAAMLRDNAAVLMSDEEWLDVLAVNLSGPFFVDRAFLMHMVGNRSGRLIHISSIASYGSSGQVNYAAAKSGLEGLNLTLAKEYGSKGITSNIVTVGYVPTDMTVENMNEALTKYWLQYCPAKRVGTPEEIAGMVFYLSTKEAGFISGENIRVSAGLTYAP